MTKKLVPAYLLKRNEFFIFVSAIEKAKENNTLLYCGEYGVIDLVSPEDTVKWYKTINTFFEKYSISRCL